MLPAGPNAARADGAVPEAPGQAARVRSDGRVDRYERHAQRRGDPPGRGYPDAALRIYPPACAGRASRVWEVCRRRVQINTKLGLIQKIIEKYLKAQNPLSQSFVNKRILMKPLLF